MPNILVSNDDGIFAPGLKTLVEAMLPLGNVWVVAPKDNQSASGHRKTLYNPLRATTVTQVFAPEVQAFAVDGSPSDCAALALLGFVGEKMDIVVSGINSGPNMGQDLTYSGTVSVAFEAAIFGLPAIAFSLNNRHPDADYTAAGIVAQSITRETLTHRLPLHTILNVNVPLIPWESIRGIQITRQGRRDYRDILDRRIDPFGRPYHWIAGVEPGGDVNEAGTDIWAVHENYVSITPVHLDLTRHEFIAPLREWQWSLGEPAPQNVPSQDAS